MSNRFDIGCGIYDDYRRDADEPETWITTESGTHIPLDEEGNPMSKVGKEIMNGGSKSKGNKSTSTAKNSPSKKGRERIGASNPDKIKVGSKEIPNEPGGAATMDHDLMDYGSFGKETQQIYDKARESEKKITDDILSIADEVGFEMDGLPFSVKTASSVADKLARYQASATSLGVNFDTANELKEMGDLVRYTQMSEHDKIASDCRRTVAAMEEKGYKCIEVDNKWTDPNNDGTYKGLHLKFKSPDGQKFEYQIHSKESMEVKNKNHVLYEESRKVDCPKAKRERLINEQKANTATLKAPKGIETIISFGNS